MATDAIRCFLESAQKTGEHSPGTVLKFRSQLKQVSVGKGASAPLLPDPRTSFSSEGLRTSASGRPSDPGAPD